MCNQLVPFSLDLPPGAAWELIGQVGQLNPFQFYVAWTPHHTVSIWGLWTQQLVVHDVDKELFDISLLMSVIQIHHSHQ